MFEISSNFIGNFKLGDNINHNFKVLAVLYEKQHECNKEDAALLCKPIIILIASICEAVLSDLHFRINNFTAEGMENIGSEILNYIRKKKVDEFGKYIDSARKHNFFDSDDSSLYEVLDSMRKLRNRIHIQNSRKHFEANEGTAFNMVRQKEMEEALEKVLKIMVAKYPRPKSASGFVENFQVPWKERL